MKYLCLILILIFTGSAWADWPQWRGPNRDGFAPGSPDLRDALPEQGLKPDWVSDPIAGARNGGWGSPVIADGKVYVFVHQRVLRDGAKLPKAKFPWLAPDKRGHLSKAEYEQYEVNRRNEDEAFAKLYVYKEIIYCIDLKSGKTKWKNQKETLYTRFVHSGTITVDGGRLYVLGAPKTMRCIDIKSRDSVWETELPGEFRDEFYMSSAAVADGVVAVFAQRLYGLDAKTGAITWRGEEKISNTHGSAAVWKQGDTSSFIVNSKGDTYCIDAKSGGTRWTIENTGAGLSTPVILPGDGLLTYGSSRRGGLRRYKMNREGAELVWEYSGAADPGASPVVCGDQAYVVGERTLACVSLADGKEAWKEFLRVQRPRYTSLIAADDQVFYSWQGLLCFKADPAGYQPVYDGKLNEAGLLATRDWHWKNLGLDQLDPGKARGAFNNKIERAGSMTCCNAAISDGRIILRRNSDLVCYDLRK